ncbi:MAG: TRAP transporter substrate-binding protein [Dehalococcoidia bacterium]|nr:MAG: TRAP transporter substrate-binding protein [Dehalococcoidia bacterium]
MGKLAILLGMLLAIALIICTGACGDEEGTQLPAGDVTPTKSIEPVTLKLATSIPNDHPAGQAYNRFSDLVHEYTDGRVQVDVYPGSQLFPATEEWEAVVTGAIDIFADASYWISPYVPDVMVFYLDGLWESYEQAYAALEDSDLPQIIAQKAEEAAPVKMLGLFPSGLVLCVVNTVVEAEELKDLTGLRCQGSPGAPTAAIYDYTGMASIPIALEEATTALMQGVVDAVLYPPGIIRDLGMHEIGKHALCRNAMFPTHALIINQDTWDNLPADIQDIIMNVVVPEIYDFFKMTWRGDEEAALEEIERNVETMHWVTEADNDAYIDYVKTHSIYKMQMLMIDPRIPEVVEGLRPGAQ